MCLPQNSRELLFPPESKELVLVKPKALGSAAVRRAEVIMKPVREGAGGGGGHSEPRRAAARPPPPGGAPLPPAPRGRPTHKHPTRWKYHSLSACRKTKFGPSLKGRDVSVELVQVNLLVSPFPFTAVVLFGLILWRRQGGKSSEVPSP